MSWPRTLKRVFAIDIERCRRCGYPPIGTYASQ
jgi:hypothetical protein